VGDGREKPAAGQERAERVQSGTAVVYLIRERLGMDVYL